MSNIILFYVPCPSLEVAKEIARPLVEKRFVACANIINNCTSIYEWEGKLEEASEVVLILKTVESFIWMLKERLAIVTLTTVLV